MWIIHILIVNLILCFIIELPSGVLLGARDFRKIITMALANVVTNPVVVLSRIVLLIYFENWHIPGILMLETGAFLAEGFMFTKFNVFENKNSYVIAFVVNLISFAIGEIINFINL